MSVGPWGEFDGALALLRAVGTTVVDHQVAVHVEQRAVVGNGAELVGAGQRHDDLPAPADAVRGGQWAERRRDQIDAHEGRLPLPVAVGIVIADQPLIRKVDRVQCPGAQRLRREVRAAPIRPQLAGHSVGASEGQAQGMKPCRQLHGGRALLPACRTDSMRKQILGANLQRGHTILRLEQECINAGRRRQQ